MSNVYIVESLYGTEYFGTQREAERCRPGGELPERVNRLDAADECNRLRKEADHFERISQITRPILQELFDVCPNYRDESHAWRKAQAYLAANPLPAATSAERDGQRSYGI